MSDAISGFGTALKQGDAASPEAFVTVAEVRNITGPNSTLETIDVTNHSSTSGFREHVAGLIDGGSLTLEINYIPTNAVQGSSAAAGTLGKFENKTKTNFKLVFPGDIEWTFTGFYDSVSPSAPIDGALTATITLKITGVVTYGDQ